MKPPLTAPLNEMPLSESWFMPPELTPLYNTSVYGELSEYEQLSYNQLHALYFHEQIIFFEQSIICPTLHAVNDLSMGIGLRSGIESFIAEEVAHSEMFRKVLREIAPGMYSNAENVFIQSTPMGKIALRTCVTHLRFFPMYFWLIMLLEERAMYCSRMFLTSATHSPFLKVQRQHLADEVNHVQWDEQLIEAVWSKISPRLRKWNVALLDWILREFIVAPKRAAIRVIDALGIRHTSLQLLIPRIKLELRELGQQSEFQQTVFCSPVALRSKRLMSQYSEFNAFSAYWFKDGN